LAQAIQFQNLEDPTQLPSEVGYMSLPTLLIPAVAAGKQERLCIGSAHPYLETPPGLECCEGNATNATPQADAEVNLLEALRAELLNTHVRLQSRWLPKESVESLGVASTAATEADVESPTSAGNSKIECLSPFAPSSPFGPNASSSVISLSDSLMPHRPEAPMREIWKEVVNGHLWIHWPVDTRKLRCKDRQIVSPSFEVFKGVGFKLMMLPKSMGERKGQACFQKARGCGTLALKLAAPLEGSGLSSPRLNFRLTIGSGRQRQASRGPVEYDFGSSLSGLPKGEDVWDFVAAADADSSTLTVSLEVLPGSTL